MALAKTACVSPQDLGPEVACEAYAAGGGLPVFVTPRTAELRQDAEAAAAWLRARHAAVEQLLDEAGGVVLRGFAFGGAADFERAIGHYPDMAFGYTAGATPRAAISGRVFEATRVPAPMKIPLHQEMAYLPSFPRRLAFFCNQPPRSGGETLIGDVRRFEERVSRTFREAVEARGVRYVRNFRAPDFVLGDPQLEAMHKTWTESFATEDPRKVEADCRAMGLEYDWNADGSVSVSYVSPGVIRHPASGRTLWFNQIATQSMTLALYGPATMARVAERYADGRALPYVTTFGDGGPIAPEQAEGLFPVLEQLEVAFPWRRGDLMLLDNFQTFHGRNPYTGGRDVQVALLG